MENKNSSFNNKILEIKEIVMTMKKVYYLKKLAMEANFRKLIAVDKPLAKETGFYEYLLNLAGRETNVRHLVLHLVIALKYATGYPINLSQHAEAMVSDAEIIQEARRLLERSAMRVQEKKSPKGIIIAGSEGGKA